VDLDPSELKAKLVLNTAPTLACRGQKNFINANFFSGSKTIGWLISDGEVLNERHEGHASWAKPKGTLIVYKDGTVETGALYDREIEERIPKIRFCCQGFNLFPLYIEKEGFRPVEVGYSTTAVSIGCNKAGKIIIAVRPKSSAQQSQTTMKNLGCEGKAIRLDSGGSANLFIDGKAKVSTSRCLTNIIYW
jgi:exopolysaccharide biosynthesis protein